MKKDFNYKISTLNQVKSNQFARNVSLKINCYNTCIKILQSNWLKLIT